MSGTKNKREGIRMKNWILRVTTIIILSISYLDTIFNLFISPNRWSALLIFFVLFAFKILTCIDSEKNQMKFKFRYGWTDLITAVLFIFRIKDKYIVSFHFNNQLIDITVYTFYASLVISVTVLMNAILSKNGRGITKIAKTIYYETKYFLLYFVLQWDNEFIKNVFCKNKQLTGAEYEILLKSAKWRKDKKMRSYPVIFRKDAEKRSFLKNWLYDISLVCGEDIVLRKARHDRYSPISFEMQVNLTCSHLAIINNDGKRFLKSLYNKDRNQQRNMKDYNQKVHAFLSNDIKPTKAESVRLCSNNFYRWGSAGTIPIITWKGKKWIAFVYRDIYPKGWNLPLGASESELEKGRPGITAIREMLEEIMVISEAFHEYSDGDNTQHIKRREIYHQLLNSIEGEVNYRANKRQFYKQQSAIIDQTYTFKFDDYPPGSKTINCENNSTSLNIRVIDNNRVNLLPNNLSTNCLIVVNCYEQAIECIKPVSFEIDDENELRMGEIDYVEEKWINNPIMLIDFQILKEYFGNQIKYTNLDHPQFGEGLFLQILQDPKNYHIFGLNMNERETHISRLLDDKKEIKKKIKTPSRKKQIKRIEAQISYLRDFIKTNKDYFDSDELSKTDIMNNPAYYLCPASWKALFYYFSKLYGTDNSIKTLGE